MTLVGTKVTIRDEALARFAAADTAAWFVTGFTERGPLGPTAVRSLADFVDTFGDKLSNSYLYDALDVFFRLGGGLAYVSRVVGPAPVAATIKLFDQSGSSNPGDVALLLTAKEVGSWANDLSAEVTAGGGNFEIVITDADDTVVESSGTLADRAAAVAWGADATYFGVGLGASNEDPRAQGPTAATGGDDDNDSATEDDWTAALALFVRDLGPGQVSAPGRTTDDAHLALVAHAAEFNRRAFIDLADTDVVADLITDAAAVTDTGDGKYAATFAPWAVVPGTSVGSTRTVPYSAVQAGLVARSEALGNSPNVPAAGALGIAPYVSSLSQDAWSDADREDLNDAGVNVALVKNGSVRTYGYRTLADPITDPEWRELGGSRTVMAIAAEADVIGEDYVLAQVDGQGKKVGEFGGRLGAVCLGYWEDGALYGATPGEAFLVDVGPSVNTPETLEDGKLLARIELATSPTAERVEIEITKTS